MTAITLVPRPTAEHRSARAPPSGSPPRTSGSCSASRWSPSACIGFPLVTVLVLAGVFGQVPDPEFGGVAPDDHYLAGYIGVVLGALGLITLPVHIATEPRARRDPPVPGVGRERRRAWWPATILARHRARHRRRWPSCWPPARPCTGCARRSTRSASSGGTSPGWSASSPSGCALGSLVPTARSAAALGNLRLRPDVPPRRRRPAPAGDDRRHVDAVGRAPPQPRRRRPPAGVARPDRRPARPLVAASSSPAVARGDRRAARPAAAPS